MSIPLAWGTSSPNLGVKVRQFLGKTVCETEFVREGEILVVNNGEGKFILLSHLSTVLRKLRTKDDELATMVLHLRVDFLQSIQLCHTVRSPEASEEVKDDGAVTNEVGGAGGVSVGVEEVEVGEVIACAHCLLVKPGSD